MSIQFPSSWRHLRVALSHDWLTGMRGGEKCLEVLCEGFPSAPVYTLIHNPAAISGTINQHDVVSSFLQKVPGIFRHYRYFLPLFPTAIQSFKRPAADLLISTSHCVAKGMPTRSDTRHLCYCFTPMRYAWTFHDEYLGRSAKRALAAPMLAALRRWDRRVSDQVHHFVAISNHVRQRIKAFYGREADVVYPPVHTEFFTPGVGPAEAGTPSARQTHAGLAPGYPDPRSFDLIVSALVPYKRVDLAVRAYTRLGFPLQVIGTGTERERLQKIAGRNIEFRGWEHDRVVRELYRRCRMLVFPGEEDFGIVPLEAQACGAPVVALARGGVLETIREGQTGVFFKQQTETALLAAVETCAARTWDPAAIRANAERFSVQRYIDGLDAAIRRCLDGK
jgi:glycosyltransferase involved in cell wall biosynthesis